MDAVDRRQIGPSEIVVVPQVVKQAAAWKAGPP